MKYFIYTCFFFAGFITAYHPLVIELILFSPIEDYSKTWFKVLSDSLIPFLAIVLAVEYARFRFRSTHYHQEEVKSDLLRYRKVSNRTRELEHVYGGKGIKNWPSLKEGLPAIDGVLEALTQIKKATTDIETLKVKLSVFKHLNTKFNENTSSVESVDLAVCLDEIVQLTKKIVKLERNEGL